MIALGLTLILGAFAFFTISSRGRALIEDGDNAAEFARILVLCGSGLITIGIILKFLH